MVDAKDYLSMEFNPTVKKNMAVEYPKIKEIFGENFDDKIIRYIILMYDIKSPLRKYYPELRKRKEFAASVAGYDMVKDDVSTLFDFKIKDGDEYVPYVELIDKIILYLKYQNNWVWSMIVSNEQAFYEYNMRVMMPVDGNRDKDILQGINIKTQIMESQHEIYKRLQSYYSELSGGDQQLEQSVILRRLRPEQIANNVQSNR